MLDVWLRLGHKWLWSAIRGGLLCVLVIVVFLRFLVLFSNSCSVCIHSVPAYYHISPTSTVLTPMPSAWFTNIRPTGACATRTRPVH